VGTQETDYFLEHLPKMVSGSCDFVLVRADLLWCEDGYCAPIV
jgi:hypothetical protein